MNSLHFANMPYFFLFALIPLLILWHLFTRKRGKRHIVYSSHRIVPKSNKRVKIFFIKNLFYFKLIALIVFILALARPQERSYYDKEKRKGIDILVTLDISGSMAAVDFRPKNRLAVAKEVIDGFIEKRSNDRLGLVIFAGVSYTKCPLTIDYDILKYFLDRTQIGDVEDGTALGMALATAVNRIRVSPGKTKIIILLTDGVNNRGEIDPRDAARIAKDYNVKVYTIGVGTKGEAPYPVKDIYGKTQYVMQPVEIDEELLKNIANQTGGLYFRATDKEQLQEIFTEIDRFEKTETTTRRYYNARDLYHWFLLGGFAVLFLVELGKRSVLRSLP